LTRPATAPASSRGFTLLEVIVAFSIAALSLSALLAIFSTGLRNAHVSREYSVAVELAESRLARIGAADPLEPGEWEGRFDQKYRWRTAIAAYTDYDSRLPGSLQPYRVTVTVSWNSIPLDRSVTLTSLRLKTVL
jgi:general secretion pathway protein I